MESNLLVNTNRETRKVLGTRPTKVIENRIDKLTLFDSKNNFRGFNLKHLENLLNLDYVKLSPSDFIRIFEVLNRNRYFEQHLFHVLYKSLYHKLNYFNFEELLTLIESIAPFSIVKHTSHPYDLASGSVDPEDDFSDEAPSDLATLDSTRVDLYELQCDILNKTIAILDNKLKLTGGSRREEVFHTKTMCLNLLNRFAFLDKWNTLLALCKDVTNHVVNCAFENVVPNSGNQITAESLLESLNYAVDTISLMSMDLLCKNMVACMDKFEQMQELDFSNLTLFYHRDIILSYFSKGDIQVFKFVLDSYQDANKGVQDSFTNLNSNLKTMCDVVKSVCLVLSSLKRHLSEESISLNLDSLLHLKFKLLYSLKYLRDVDNHTFNRQYDLGTLYGETLGLFTETFVSHKDSLEAKNKAVLISLLTEMGQQSMGRHVDFKNNNSFPGESGDRLFTVVRELYRDITEPRGLTSLECLNILESTYRRFGFVNHYVARKLMHYVLNNFPKNPLDSVVTLRALHFSLNLPFGGMYRELESVKRSCELARASKPLSNSFDFKGMDLLANSHAPKSVYNSTCSFDYIPRTSWSLKSVRTYSSVTFTSRLLAHLGHKCVLLYYTH